MQLKGIRRQRRGERVIRYHRASGVRLPDDVPETHPDFIAAWARAEAMSAGDSAKYRVAEGSIAAANRAMQSGRWWAGVSPGYRHALKRDGDAIAAAYGNIRAALITPAHIEADLARFTIGAGNNRLKAWRRIMQASGVTPDPSKSVSKQRTDGEGFHCWTADEIASYRAFWSAETVQRRCMELLFWTAARTADAVRLGRANVGADGILSFRQSKTGGMAYVPWTNELPGYARSWAAERAAVVRMMDGPSFTFLEARGRGRSIKGLGQLIAEGAQKAGLIGCTAHGLRKARLTAIAEAGGSSHAIMAWGGHKTLAEVAHYTEAAEKRLLVGGNARRTMYQSGL